MVLLPYLHLVRTSFLTLLAYRMRFVTGIATYSIFVGVHVAVWQAVFAARGPGGSVGGFDLATLTTYLAIGYIARSAYFTNTDSEIAARFQKGEVVMDLLKPLHMHGNWLAQAGGETLFRIVCFAAPMTLVMVPLFGVQPPAGDGWWQFPLLFLCAFWVNTELNLLAGTACFWLEDITGLMSLKRNLIMLASGLMVPLHFLAGIIGETATAVLVCSPLAAIGSYPALAWVGRLGVGGTPDFPLALGLAVAWIVALRLANIALWARARERLEVQGG